MNHAYELIMARYVLAPTVLMPRKQLKFPELMKKSRYEGLSDIQRIALATSH